VNRLSGETYPPFLWKGLWITCPQVAYMLEIMAISLAVQNQARPPKVPPLAVPIQGIASFGKRNRCANKKTARRRQVSFAG
jgi:hypothetical protein